MSLAVLDRSRLAADAKPVAPAAPAAVRTGAPYGFAAPTLESAKQAFLDVFGTDRAGENLWSELLGAARISGGTADLAALARLAAAMIASQHAVVSLCGHSLQIRVRTFEELAQVAEICRVNR